MTREDSSSDYRYPSNVTTTATNSSFVERKGKHVTFLEIEVIRVERFKKYNKLSKLNLQYEEEENERHCKCLIF